MANELAFCTFDQLEEFIKSCQNHNEEEKEEEYHDQLCNEGNVLEEDFHVCCSHMNLSHEVLERVIQAIREEWQARCEHKIKLKKVLRCIKHPKKRQYILDHDEGFGYSRIYLNSEDEVDSDVILIQFTILMRRILMIVILLIRVTILMRGIMIIVTLLRAVINF